jgi:hypothetical protein
MEANTRRLPVRIVVVTGPQETSQKDSKMMEENNLRSCPTNISEREEGQSHSMRRSRWPLRLPERPKVDTSLETASISSDEFCSPDLPSTACRLLQNDCFPDFANNNNNDEEDYGFDDETQHSILETSTNTWQYSDDDKSQQRRRRKHKRSYMARSQSNQSINVKPSQSSSSTTWWQNTIQDFRETLHDASDAFHQVLHAFELPEQDLSCVSKSIQSTRRHLKRTQRFFTFK